eukprot:5832646-Alexandrium_andersonii.AAC.1
MRATISLEACLPSTHERNTDCDDESTHWLLHPWQDQLECCIDGTISSEQVWTALDMVEWGRPQSSDVTTLYVCGKVGAKRLGGAASVAM